MGDNTADSPACLLVMLTLPNGQSCQLKIAAQHKEKFRLVCETVFPGVGEPQQAR